MLEVALLVARYGFLALLYLFLFLLYRGMLRELRERYAEGSLEEAAPQTLQQRPSERFPPPAEPRWRLVLIESGEEPLPPGTFYRIAGPLTLGRASDNTLVLRDRFASGHHARLTLQPGGELWLEDLGSTNGTRLNGQEVTAPVPLQGGDEIRIGTVCFRVEPEVRRAS
jgi:hypothetical protein